MPTIKEKTIRTIYMNNNLWFALPDLAVALGVEYTPDFAQQVPSEFITVFESSDGECIACIVETVVSMFLDVENFPKKEELLRWIITKVYPAMWYIVHVAEEGEGTHVWVYDL